jgi:hypothetical protein
MLRVLLIAFNVAIMVFLIYRMTEAFRTPMRSSKKTVFIIGALMLLLVPVGIFLKFFAPSHQYLIIYPAAIAVFLYMTRQL